jgi:dimethylaniline monooxygenase (N-oxide forming)
MARVTVSRGTAWFQCLGRQDMGVQHFLHDAAGTGMENLGYGWKGWKFFIHDPKMSWLMNNGVETAHAFRYFETAKRRTWEGAREAIIKANEAVKVYPLKVAEKQL